MITCSKRTDHIMQNILFSDSRSASGLARSRQKRGWWGRGRRVSSTPRNVLNCNICLYICVWACMCVSCLCLCVGCYTDHWGCVCVVWCTRHINNNNSKHVSWSFLKYIANWQVRHERTMKANEHRQTRMCVGSHEDMHLK